MSTINRDDVVTVSGRPGQWTVETTLPATPYRAAQTTVSQVRPTGHRSGHVTIITVHPDQLTAA